VPDPDPDAVFAGVPDAFGRLWTPHRLAYIKGENKPSGPGEDEGCPFDRAPKLSDTEGLIVARGELVRRVGRAEMFHAGRERVYVARSAGHRLGQHLSLRVKDGS